MSPALLPVGPRSIVVMVGGVEMRRRTEGFAVAAEAACSARTHATAAKATNQLTLRVIRRPSHVTGVRGKGSSDSGALSYAERLPVGGDSAAGVLLSQQLAAIWRRGRVLPGSVRIAALDSRTQGE